MKKLLLLLLFTASAYGQVSNPSIISVSTAPSGACSAGLPNQQVITTGTQYSCQSGTWAAIGGSGGTGTVTSVTFTGDGTILSSTPSSAVTTSGTLTATLAAAAQNSVLAGPATGGAGAPSYQTAPTFSAANLTSFPATLATYPGSGIANSTGTAWGTSYGVSGTGSVVLNTSPTIASLTVTGTTSGITATMVGLGSVTNNAQTQAAVVPNTAPTAGQVLLGNAGGTAYAPVSLTQDCTVTSAGVVTCLKTNNTAFTSAAITAIGTSGATIPLLNTGNTFSAEQIFSTSSTGTVPGTLFSGLASTTNPYAPVVDIFASGATVPTRPAAGTILELNAASGFTGSLITSFVNGVATGFNVNYSGLVNMAGFNSSSNASITGQLTLTSGLQALSTEIPSNNKYGFSSTTANNGTIDTVICRGASAGNISLESAATCTNTVAGGTATVAMAVLDLTSTQTTVSCSTSGSAIFSEPFQGPSDKKVLIHLTACLGTASYTYPTAFTNTPSCYASANVACTVLTSTSTTAVTVTGATTTGSVSLEDY